MIDDEDLQRWFCEDVLPHESSLMRYIRRNCRDAEASIDVRQDVYVRALNGARRGLPVEPLFYLFTIARNVLINRARRAKIVSFELVADLEAINWDDLAYSSERQLDARDELRRTQAGLDQLPPRCREVVNLRKIEGLSTNEVAERLGISTHTVERQLTLGMRALVDFMLGGEGRIVRWKKSDPEPRKIST
jgi:RNA polymerase sigma-70 factor (ECF subfamily)